MWSCRWIFESFIATHRTKSSPYPPPPTSTFRSNLLEGGEPLEVSAGSGSAGPALGAALRAVLVVLFADDAQLAAWQGLEDAVRPCGALSRASTPRLAGVPLADACGADPPLAATAVNGLVAAVTARLAEYSPTGPDGDAAAVAAAAKSAALASADHRDRAALAAALVVAGEKALLRSCLAVAAGLECSGGGAGKRRRVA